MLFSSPVFLFLFLPLLLLLYWSVPRPARNAVLLVASIVFYVWGERFFFVVMLASIAANWLIGLALDALEGPTQRKAMVAFAVVLNIGLLAVFKYTEFLVGNLNDLLALVGAAPVHVVSPHLPLGISFFTFHALSYVIDVYRGVATAQRKPIDFALYIAFFPQLIAGPIIRYHDIYKQLTRRTVTLELLASGTERFLAGFGKKMLLANPLGEVADQIFALPAAELSPGAAWLGVICYTLQIYLDFSAYSDMAIGLARIFGFHFLENFNYPYLSRSLQEFWRRWHISLSNWLRDYLYIPLGGSRVVNWRIYLNLFIVFFVCGLWHGANWTFVVWGMIHGGFLIVERLGLAHWLAQRHEAVRHAYTLLVVSLAWVFFRAADVTQATHYLQAMFGLGGNAPSLDFLRYVDPTVVISLTVGAFAAAGVFTRLTSDWRCRAGQRDGVLHPPLETVPLDSDGRWVLGARLVILLAIGVLGCSQVAAGTYNPFIYFRF
ncbi:MBOAT family O-acyltransferase [Rhodopseudomonas palustris]|uniref:Probable alginate O-acetylase AlgI n=1 Tax=Rhodopseudomonas palustris TaxID=1076 RepID=A0A418VIN5_RHOPL|nr:MBOAT family protein [Rhodopseudomonas palustris]RJF75956.1 MBOAT family protein [Rhodopseudomonas palustris]